MSKYRKIACSGGDVFYEDLNRSIILEVDGDVVRTLPPTPDAFYKFRTDIESVERVTAKTERRIDAVIQHTRDRDAEFQALRHD